MRTKARSTLNSLDFVAIGKFCVFTSLNHRIMVSGKLLNKYFIMIIIRNELILNEYSMINTE